MSTLRYSSDQLETIRKAISHPTNDWDRAAKEMYKTVARNLVDHREYPSVATLNLLRQKLNAFEEKRFATEMAEGIVCYLAWQDKMENQKSGFVFQHFRLVALFSGLAIGAITYPLFGDYKAVVLGMGVTIVLTAIWWLRINN